MERADLLEVGDPLIEESKFSLVIVGHCPHCGSPIWAKRPKELQSDPPKNEYSCECLALVQMRLTNEAAPQLQPYTTQPFTWPSQPTTLPSIQINPAPLVGVSTGRTSSVGDMMGSVTIDPDVGQGATYNYSSMQNKADPTLDGVSQFSYSDLDGSF